MMRTEANIITITASTAVTLMVTMKGMLVLVAAILVDATVLVVVATILVGTTVIVLVVVTIVV